MEPCLKVKMICEVRPADHHGLVLQKIEPLGSLSINKIGFNIFFFFFRLDEFEIDCKIFFEERALLYLDLHCVEAGREICVVSRLESEFT